MSDLIRQAIRDLKEDRYELTDRVALVERVISELEEVCNWETPSVAVECIPPSIDFTQLSAPEGSWVVVRKATHELLGSGFELSDALAEADYQHYDISVIVARMPCN